MIDFKVIHKSKKSNARIGILRTPHGEIETPSFVGVATQAVVKTLTAKEVEETKSQILISNTFHLHLKPGEDFLKKAGGIHKFMNWNKPLMTDSGGFQVFSLGFGRDHGVGKILKEKSDLKVTTKNKPKNVKITEDGVFFRSPKDGQKLFIGPKESIKIQEAIGADIMFAFDECTSPVADYYYTKRSLEKTHRWAQICLDSKTTDQALYGIVQGGKFENLRTESAKYIGSLPFDGFGIGGEFGDEKRTMSDMLALTLPHLLYEKPVHLLGIGHLEDIPEIMKSGVDTFDCIVPTHYARHGVAFTSEGRMDMRKSKYLSDPLPLDEKCPCLTCITYKRNYITHLFKADEITALRLLTFHNLYYFNSYVESLREEIKKNAL
ncbi:MAG: tRNA guanosine(34) transglycosylase Tgt [Candidatus Levybacteria bacterium]|nr:tRNA guanosine(34) transglycosylase Tgt [Candidatus Levybacteria bacterium]